MDLLEIMVIMFKVLLVLVPLYAVMIFFRRAKQEEVPEHKKPSSKTCSGHLNASGEKCKKSLFRCINCGETGCEQVECDNRNFQPPGQCLSCEYPNTIGPV